MTKKTKIMLAAGGTGGHIFPAESLAQVLIDNGHEVVFISDKRYRKYSHTPSHLEVKKIAAAPLSGGLLAKLKAVVSIFLGIAKAISIIKNEKPDVVVGFGGYPSFPTMIAAIITKHKTVIHEQNAVLGKVNRIVAPYVDVIATSFEKTSGIKEGDKKKVVMTGNPIRPAIIKLKEFDYPEIKKGDGLHILVIGGSQGANIFSQVVPNAILSLPDKIKSYIRVDQQCRQEDIIKVRELYEKDSVNVELATFFEDMPARLAAAHLVISRSGASSISELTVAGKPSILVPYMYAADDHQTANAKAIEKAGAAVLVSQENFTSEVLKEKLEELIKNPSKLSDMSVRAKAVAKDKAVDDLVRLVLGVIKD